MNEFRKPYEYEEEKGVSGFLLLFFIMLLTFETLLGVITLCQGYTILRPTPYLSGSFLVLGSGNFLLTLFVCFALKRIPKYAIQVSKILLVIRAIYLSLACIVIYSSVSKSPEILSKFSSKFYLSLSYLLIPFIYILGFSISWYWYLLKSKKVREYRQMAE